MSIDIQENLVREVAGIVPETWEKITINIEIDDLDGEIVKSDESDYWVKDDFEEFDLTFEAYELFSMLRQVMAKNDATNRLWTICDLEILSDGSFEFKFSYDEPPRLATLK